MAIDEPISTLIDVPACGKCCGECTCENAIAGPVVQEPGIFAHIREDIQTVFTKDPAARSVLEVLLAYPGLHAIWAHRVAHWLWRTGCGAGRATSWRGCSRISPAG